MILAMNPVPKPRMTQRDRWAKRPAVVRYYAFCDELRELWGELSVPDQVNLIFTIPMPNSWSNLKKTNMIGKPHQQRPDIDNLVKAFLDALMKDDSVVWSIKAEKVWGEWGSIEVVDTVAP